jgi:hypothetical protein
MSQIRPSVEQTGKSRSQNSFFSVQHENVLLVQRIASGEPPRGSYNSGKISMDYAQDTAIAKYPGYPNYLLDFSKP